MAKNSLSRFLSDRVDIMIMPRSGASKKFKMTGWGLLGLVALWLLLTLGALWAWSLRGNERERAALIGAGLALAAAHRQLHPVLPPAVDHRDLHFNQRKNKIRKDGDHCVRAGKGNAGYPNIAVYADVVNRSRISLQVLKFYV